MVETVLVTGGAGYIGSHTTRHLLDAGYQVVVLDNLYSGFKHAVADEAEFVEGNAGDVQLVSELIKKHNITAVVHFAGYVVVPESVAEPMKYYSNNSIVSKNLMDTCQQHGVNDFLFSSTSAVYGMPEVFPVTEDMPLQPISPYGRSKLITEWMLKDLAFSTKDSTDPFRYVALRYFNVAGASIDGKIGQETPEATHLLKVACQTACGKRDSISVYGTDYDTEDGTCIRDYIHVEDLAAAHVAALKYLQKSKTSGVFNCGYGKGFSVKQVLDTVRKVSGVDFAIQDADRRAGDPAAVVANNTLIRSTIDWQPKYDDIELICKTAYEWEKKLS